MKVDVVRNLPIRNRKEFLPKSRSEFGIPTDKPVFLFQGAGINIDRGAEEAIQAISLLSDAVLLFIGGGDVIDLLRKKVDDENLNHKVFFIGKKPLSELPSYTALADFGLTLDKDTNLNYKYSLPNKLFDYINAGLPVLATDLPEVRKIVADYQIGLITPSSEPHILAESMEVMVKNRSGLDLWKENLKIAAAELCWENEEKKLLEVFRDVVA
ncbi:MAG: glycosyltransferase [Bacteroidia bacterium]